MNYYEHHIGDYDKNTSHLTACEDGIYSRLIRRYYDKEKPLPADVDQVKRLARARDKLERAAVDTILEEFFTLEADGWHHKVCDAVIAAYLAGEPEREAKKIARAQGRQKREKALVRSEGQREPRRREQWHERSCRWRIARPEDERRQRTREHHAPRHDGDHQDEQQRARVGIKRLERGAIVAQPAQAR